MQVFNGSKAAPETGTTPANATGILESALNPLSTREYLQQPPSDVLRSGATTNRPSRPIHSYTGNDPNILAILDKFYEDSQVVNDGSDNIKPVPIPALRQPLRQNTNRPQHAQQTWHPEGTLIAHLTEHTAPINRVIVSPDHTFFLTASDDGTVKVWDTVRLEKNVVNRARLTHRHEGTGVKVKAVCFVEGTHVVASAGDDGSIHVYGIEYSVGTLTPKYGKIKVSKTYQLDQSEYAVWMESYRQDHRLILVVATNLSRILSFDLRTMQILYVLQNPPHHGTPTTFTLDRTRHSWLLLGTTRGILDLWDLRFLLRLRAFGIPPYTPIRRLATHPSRGHGKWIVVAGGAAQGDITVWDIDKLQCREIFRPSIGGLEGAGRGYEAYRIDDDKPEGPLGRFAVDPDTKLDVQVGGQASVNTIFVGRDWNRGDGSVDSKHGTGGFIISAGADRKVRFWDLGKPESSSVVSGLQAEECKPTFTGLQASPSLSITVERAGPNGGTVKDGMVAGGKKKAGSGGAGRPSRQAFISIQQEKLLKNHLDAVLDVALIEVPYAMIVSVDRAGCINIFA